MAIISVRDYENNRWKRNAKKKKERKKKKENTEKNIKYSEKIQRRKL